MTVIRAVAVALGLALWSAAALAQDITLTSHDGAVAVTGDLLGYDGEFYRVATQFGTLTIDGSGVSCDGLACPNLIDFVADLRFSGASVMSEKLLPALIVGFARQEGLTATPVHIAPSGFVYELHQPDRAAPLARFHFQVGNTDQGFADLIDGTADIALTMREPSAVEIEAAKASGLGDLTQARRSRVLALDAIVPVVAAQNPIRQISPGDLALILSGQISNWSTLNGPDAPIAIHVPEAGSGLSQVTQSHLLTPIEKTISEAAIPHQRNSHLVAHVARDPFSIGMANQAETGSGKALALTGGCGHALTATRHAIKTEDYPLTAPLFLYLPPHRLPRIARQFLTYALGADAQPIIREAGFVDQALEETDLGLQGNRLANAITSGATEVGLEELHRVVNTLRPMSRLSVSFRFEPGSSRPDAQSRSNILYLAQALEGGRFDSRKLVFVGFSDGNGATAANARISLLRAKTVRNAVLAAMETTLSDNVQIQVEGFGEAMPMACDDSEWGRKINRRVEVWVE